MKKKPSIHTIQIPLCTTGWEEQVIDKRFHAIAHIHNVMVKHAKRQLRILSFHTGYQQMRQEYMTLLSEAKEAAKKGRRLQREKQARKTELSNAMKEIRLAIGLSDFSFRIYIKKCQHRFKTCISSQQAQKEASRVWRGVEKVLFGNGGRVHFKKFMDFSTISGASNKNGVRFYREDLSITWLGLKIPCKRPKKDSDMEYMTESLSGEICYCELKRQMFPNGWHYYVIVYLKGDAPKKVREIGDGTMGIDPGVSTMAGVSDTNVFLRELAPDCDRYNRKIVKLQRELERSKRTSNPQRYHPDGRLKKQGWEKWVFSNTYLKKQKRLKSLYRQKALYIRVSHKTLANEMLRDSRHFIVEEMSYRGLQKRAKQTERKEEVSAIPQRDGSVKQVRKFKKKKRFGKSLNNRAPATFLSILEQKALFYGGSYEKVDTREFRASQYEHDTDTYKKIPLSQRKKQIDGHIVQRDLYSAFLIKNTDKDFKHPDREKCSYDFQNFIVLHDACIQKIKQTCTANSCFGF